MTWPVRSALLGRHVGSATGGTYVSLFVVPAGKTWLVKDWRWYNASGITLDINLTLFIAGVAGVVDRVTNTAAGGFIRINPCGWVCPAGSEMKFVISNTANIHLHLSGAKLG